jgi:hypothetical protein
MNAGTQCQGFGPCPRILNGGKGRDMSYELDTIIKVDETL